MAYDDTAKRLAIKAIGTVESGLNYSSINYNDPITVGVLQWYGTRAAALLLRIIDENPSSWVGIPSSLTDSMNAHPAGDSWWTTRYLTRAEGEPLKEVLNLNRSIQIDQGYDDLDGYLSVAVNTCGFDADANTDGMLFFFVMYHQSPRRALAVVASLGAASNIDRLLAGALNEPVLGRYPTRYRTAATIIKSHDPSGVDPPPGPEPDPEPEGGDNGGGEGASQPPSTINYIRQVGDSLHVHLADGDVIIAAHWNADVWRPSTSSNNGAPVPEPEPNPDPPDPDPGDPTRAALVKFVTDRINRYAYSQGASRLDPEKNMYTDCSGLMYYTFQSVMGINIGTYTGNQYDKGILVAQGNGSDGLDPSLLVPSDLVFFDWPGGRSTVDHVDMYIGTGNICGHGGPGSGPNIKPLATSVARCLRYWVRRHA